MQIISDYPQHLIQKFKDKWVELASDAIEKKGSFLVALSGGRTPQPFLNALKDVDGTLWEKTSVFQVDERVVPEDDPDSNWSMLRRELLDHVVCSSMYPLVTNPDNPGQDIERYQYLLEGVQFDLILLGLGDDGHTASLFPENNFSDMKESVALTRCSYLPHERLSLTFPVINHAQHLVFLVLGQSKKEIVQRVLDGDQALPAAHVKTSGDLILMTDIEGLINEVG